MAELAAKYPNVDPFLLKKWELVFHKFFDVNANQTVEWGDFYVVHRHCRDIYGHESVQVGYAKKALKSLWDGLLSMADRNHDDKIQLDEWIKVLASVDPKKSEPKWFLEYLMFMFKLFDVSADDLLDVSEYTDGMTCYGVDAHVADKCFKAFAKDKQGQPVRHLTEADWMKLWTEFFWGTDQKAKGNYLFGDFLEHAE